MAVAAMVVPEPQIKGKYENLRKPLWERWERRD